jgi:hypothetical protein
LSEAVALRAGRGGRTWIPWVVVGIISVATVAAAELVVDPDGNHGLTNHAFESRSRSADRLAARL